MISNMIVTNKKNLSHIFADLYIREMELFWFI